MEDANPDDFELIIEDDSDSNDEMETNQDDVNRLEQFNIDLASEHNYLGNLERVSGVQYLEPNRNYTLPITFHGSLVFPGETVPMILSQNMYLSAMMNESDDEGLLFGLIFKELRSTSSYNLYGVTCQIYEKSNVPGDNVSIKSRAYQRFIIKSNEPIPDHYPFRHRISSATVTILPEIVLPDPIYGHDSTSLSRFRCIEELKTKLQHYQSKSLAWPQFVYKMYDAVEASKKIKEFLLTLKIETGPMDLVSLSFWFSKNAILSRECRHKLFLTNNVFERIILIRQSLKEEKVIICKECGSIIARFDSLFAMSKEGIRTNFCNANGFIHDTHTIMDTLPDVISYEGRLTDEFSWFPGYSWRFVHCAQCNAHLGWKYFSRNLMPRSFIGLTGAKINFANASSTGADNDTDDLSEYESEE